VGFPPALFLVFVVTLAANGKNLLKETTSLGDNQRSKKWRAKIAVLIGSAVVVSLVLILKVDGHSLWWYVRKIVPGASAMSAPSRYTLALSVPVLVVTMIGLSQFWQRLSAFNASSTPKFLRPVKLLVLVLCLVLAVEQLSAANPNRLSKSAKLALLAQIYPRPDQCKVAYVSASQTGTRPWYEYQNDGMLIALSQTVPTVNGYSGNFPRDWNLWNPADPAYPNNVDRWLVAHGLQDVACGVSVDTGRWETEARVRISKALTYHLGQEINFKLNANNARPYEVTGWYEAEESGTWTMGERASLLMNVSSFRRTGDVSLKVRVRPLVIPTSPELSIQIVVNGTIVLKTVLKNDGDLNAHIPVGIINPQSLIRIDFLIDNPKVPLELGLNQDPRRLGMVVESLVLTEETSDR
jgi:hypothetical protein